MAGDDTAGAWTEWIAPAVVVQSAAAAGRGEVLYITLITKLDYRTVPAFLKLIKMDFL